MNYEFGAKMNKFTALLTLTLILSACQKSVTSEQETVEVKNNVNLEQIKEVTLEESFWNALTEQCTHIFTGQSSYPDNPEDSFYGKKLVANFSNCTDTQIQVPFHVGDNKSRTWIFTKLDNGKLQLKHQHLHDDGSADEVSNYGGISDGGEISINGQLKTMHVHFPADDFTKQLIPEASTNVWTIELISNGNAAQDSMSYNLYRHSKKRFIASLTKNK